MQNILPPGFGMGGLGLECMKHWQVVSSASCDLFHLFCFTANPMQVFVCAGHRGKEKSNIFVFLFLTWESRG